MPLFSLIILLSFSMGKLGEAIQPLVTLSPNYGNILTGDSVTLTCVAASAKDNPTYRWYKDNQELAWERQRSLVVHNAKEEDSGQYRCWSSSNGYSDLITLSVSNSFIALQGPPPPIYEGDPLTLKCHHHKNSDGDRYSRFFKNGKKVPSSGSELRVPAADTNTAGTYQCRKWIRPYLAHDYTDYLSEDVVISVKEIFSKPEIIMSTSRISEGAEMRVRCYTRLEYLRRNTQLQFAFYINGGIVQELSVSDTYHVQYAQPWDSGNYTCEVRTVSGNVRKISDLSRMETINELFCDPEIKRTPDRVILGREMTLTCDTIVLDSLRRDTELRFAFYRGGDTVRGFNASNTYHVLSTQLKDSGNYTCEVTTASRTVRKTSDIFWVELQDYSRQNTVRLLLSGCLSVAVLVIIYFHNKS